MSGNVLPWWSGLWCMQQTIPYSLDTASLSALEILNKLVKAVDGIISDGKITAEEIVQLQEQMKSLDALVKDVANGKYAELYIDQLAAYIDTNLVNFVARIVKYVFPSFYWDGDCWRLSLSIPTSWDWLEFRFVWVPEDFSYHITLNY